MLISTLALILSAQDNLEYFIIDYSCFSTLLLTFFLLLTFLHLCIFHALTFLSIFLPLCFLLYGWGCFGFFSLPFCFAIQNNFSDATMHFAVSCCSWAVSLISTQPAFLFRSWPVAAAGGQKSQTVTEGIGARIFGLWKKNNNNHCRNTRIHKFRSLIFLCWLHQWNSTFINRI